MRSFLRFLLILAVALAALIAYLPRRYGTPWPEQPGPKFDNAIRSAHTRVIQERGVKVVLLGDSVLEQGVDEFALSAELNVPAHAIAVPGSTSAFWYLILKNVILQAEPHPATVALLFRDTILTLPNYHVKGGYINELDQFATAREDVLQERAYLNFMNPLEKAALSYLPLYRKGQQFKERTDGRVRNLIPGVLFSCDADCVARADATVYHVENLRPEFVHEALAGDEDFLFTRAAMDFDALIEQSFLPEIIRVARENNVQLILVHERTQIFPSVEAEPKALRIYKQKLAAYLEQNDIPLVDFSYDPRLPKSYFVDILHMNAEGKALFTQLLAEALRPFLQP
ncbi:MAG: hypothetical protein HY867_15470 [Chloroflexi bacterium]|nr:hypothetical protein [Chloroflexota bacterium]